MLCSYNFALLLDLSSNKINQSKFLSAFLKIVIGCSLKALDNLAGGLSSLLVQCSIFINFKLKTQHKLMSIMTPNLEFSLANYNYGAAIDIFG